MGISVIIPVFNIEKYIIKCIESIEALTDVDLEIIVVNDGSTDRSKELCEEMVLKYGNIRLISQKNAGLSGARNTGLKYVTKEFCIFLDGDDYFIDAAPLKNCIEKMKNDDVDILIFGLEKIDENGKVLKKAHYVTKKYSLPSKQNVFGFIYKNYLSCQYEFTVWNKIYRTEIIKKNNIQFIPNAEIFAEDICFNLEYLLYVKKIYVDSENLYGYLQRNNSIMGKIESTQIERILNLCEYIYSRYKNIGIPYEYVKDVINCLIAHEFWLHGSKVVLNKIEKINKMDYLCEFTRKNNFEIIQKFGWKNSLILFPYFEMIHGYKKKSVRYNEYKAVIEIMYRLKKVYGKLKIK